ncbi:MAG: helix-turn-helix transcriptional regulator [Planctomycetota bacterium]
MTQITLNLPDGVAVLDVLATVDRQHPDVEIVMGREFDPDWMQKLSPNQRDIVRLLGNGVAARQIAEIARVKIGTVRTQIQNVRNKLGIGSLGELIELAKKSDGNEAASLSA